jgi:hypothetical protein
MTWFERRRRKHWAPSASALQLVTETEAFLSGGYADHLTRTGLVVPTWAWLNGIAHGDLQTLADSSGPSIGKPWLFIAQRPEDFWWDAQRLLATELLKFVGNDATMLVRVQCSVLVPLEFELMRDEVDTGLTAYEIVRKARSALRSWIP